MRQQNQIIALLHKTLRHMAAMSGGHHKGGILLTGDPGIGKTTYVDMLGSLLGIKVVTIEVPHITEEHLINIPFIVYNPATNNKSVGQTQMTQEYKLVLAKSNLYSQLTNSQPLPDAAYLQHMKTAPAVIQQLFVQLGGNETTIPDAIGQARQSHKIILFLDEYYRQTSPRIRNILRGILNNKIGMHEIPPSTYVMYASNMKDQGLEDLASNAQFTAVEFKTPTKNDWFDWLVAKYNNDSRIQLNMTVIDEFKKLLKDEDMSHTDIASEVRTSPRRWEQLLMYIGTSLPADTLQDARSVMSNVKNSFVHYQTGQHSELAKKVCAAVVKLIKETSNIKAKPGDVNDPHEWRTSLDHMIKQQMKAGGKMKYIPVVSGLPGIGKTQNAVSVAKQNKMRLIDVDVSELNADDVIGMPLPGNRSSDDEEISVRFSVPKLYRQILDQIDKANRTYHEQLKKENPETANEKFEEFKHQEWKYLIFFDEINRADEKTFNALRRVILEKNFGPSGDESGSIITLPKGSLVIAAMNPEGAGTSELTHHFRDVINVIPANASWAALRKLFIAQKFNNIDDDVKDVALNVMDAFVAKFKSTDTKYTAHDAPFNLDIGTHMYVSPREYSDMFATLTREINAGIKHVISDPDIKENEMREEMDEVISESLEDSLNFVFHKHGIEKEEFINTLRTWVSNLEDTTFGGVLSKKAKNINSLSSVLGGYLDGTNLEKMPSDINIINANNTMNNAQFIEEIRQTFLQSFIDDQYVKHFILDETQPKVTLSNDKLVASSDKTSLLTNFILSLLYTLHIHQYKNDRITSVGRALSTAVGDTVTAMFNKGKMDEDTKSEVTTAIVQLRSDVHDLIAGL